MKLFHKRLPTRLDTDNHGSCSHYHSVEIVTYADKEKISKGGGRTPVFFFLKKI